MIKKCLILLLCIPSIYSAPEGSSSAEQVSKGGSQASLTFKQRLHHFGEGTKCGALCAASVVVSCVLLKQAAYWYQEENTPLKLLHESYEVAGDPKVGSDWNKKWWEAFSAEAGIRCLQIMDIAMVASLMYYNVTQRVPQEALEHFELAVT